MSKLLLMCLAPFALLASTRIAAADAVAPPTRRAAAAKPVASADLNRLFRDAARAFWSVEPQFNNYYAPIEELPPLAADDPDAPRYRHAARAAERYLKAVDNAPEKNAQQTTVMLYFAAMSYSIVGDDLRALPPLNRLLEEYAAYKRPRIEGFGQFDRPTQAGLLHLKMYHQNRLLQTAVQTNQVPQFLKTFFAGQTTLAALQSMTQRGALSLAGAAWKPDGLSGEEARSLDYALPTPDQLRVAALPDVVRIVTEMHESLLPLAMKENAPTAIRAYLRGLRESGNAWSGYATGKLVSIDEQIIAGYRQAAQQALNEKRFDDAKAQLRVIIAEYGGSQVAEDAAAQLKGIVPVAVKFYRDEGDGSFRPGGPGQFGVPQTRAREFFQKMYEEDPDGPQADYALYWWSRGVGTEAKPEQALTQYELLLSKFPNSPLVPNAMFAMGFIYGANFNRQYDKAIGIMMQIVEKYPNSDKAPEALWHSAFWRAYGQKHYTEAMPFLERLRQYPDSAYLKHIDEELEKYRKWIKEGKGT